MCCLDEEVLAQHPGGITAIEAIEAESIQSRGSIKMGLTSQQGSVKQHHRPHSVTATSAAGRALMLSPKHSSPASAKSPANF